MMHTLLHPDTETPVWNTPAITCAQTFESFRKRELALACLQQTLRLTADIQQHRGSSMAILAGNLDFEPRLALLQEKIQQRLKYLYQSRVHDSFLSDDYWQAILQEWQTVSQGWRDDTVLHNFELHCHLIEKLLQLMRAGGNWLIEADTILNNAVSQGLDMAVMSFAFQTLPLKIEILAKLRGLSTHAATTGHCDNEHWVRIEYLLQLAKREQTHFRSFTAQRPVKVLRLIPSLLDTQMNEVVFTQWSQRISEEILQKGKLRRRLADELFAQGTHIIDGFFAINQQSLTYIRLALEDMLEGVLSSTVQNASIQEASI